MTPYVGATPRNARGATLPGTRGAATLPATPGSRGATLPATRGTATLPGTRGTATGRNVGSLLLRGAYRTRVVGADHVPRVGPAILAANHLGFLDVVLLFGASPRPVHVMSKSENFAGPLEPLLRSVGQVELHDESPDRSAMHEALALLADGRAVGVFPEAHRGRGDLRRIRHGVAYLAARSGAPVVPVALLGTRTTGMSRDALPRPRSPLVVVYGEPFTPAFHGDPLNRRALAGLGETIRQRLADHVAQAVRRVGIALPDDDVDHDDVPSTITRATPERRTT